jgi:myo-inositol 2-dehydrogenase/D-chiro-inositol 1-dehydrogenase
MPSRNFSRRSFLQASAGLAAAGFVAPHFFSSASRAQESDKLRLGSIGVGGQGTGIMKGAIGKGAVLLAVCDVDKNHAERAKKETGGTAEIYEDYRKLLDRKDLDIVTIGTPDHWHTAICLAALRAGKDVYCEKPLTLTIAEGQLLVKTVKETGRVLQVGTQQRSSLGLFARAVATVRGGQLGKLQKVTVSLPLSTSEGGPFPAATPPPNLNWDMWLGQAPQVEYCPQRCHFQFRWWYEYSGGIATDWGAHHMDIAQWGLNAETSGPLSIDGSKTTLPKIAGGYNTPKRPVIDFMYPGDVHVQIVTGDEGVLFEGDKSRIYVNRGRITGKPIEDQDADAKLKEKIMEAATALYKGNKVGDHMGNFFEAVRSKGAKPTISDVVSQHRSVSACHLGNISCRLGRKLTWDTAKETFVGDDEANTYLSRMQRKGYEVA